MTGHLRSPRLPTLVIHGGDADPLPAWAARQVAELVPATEFVWCRRAGHLPWLKQATMVREVLRRFLRHMGGLPVWSRRRVRMTSMEIRTAAVADVPPIAQLQRAWAEEGTAHGFIPATDAQIRAALGPFLLVAQEEGRIVGFVSASRRAGEGNAVIPPGPYLEIDDLYVVPGRRGQGIGRRLVERVLDEARAQGLRYASVYTAVKDVRRVMRFYEEAGFESWFVQMFHRL